MAVKGIIVHIFMLFYAGGHIQTRWMKWSYISSSAIFSIGILLSIMHWPGKDVVPAISTLICLFIFGFHFINQPDTNGSKRSLQDYLLLVWLIFSALNFLQLDIPHAYNSAIYLISSLLLLINFVYVLYLDFFNGG